MCLASFFTVLCDTFPETDLLGILLLSALLRFRHFVGKIPFEPLFISVLLQASVLGFPVFLALTALRDPYVLSSPAVALVVVFA